MNTPPTIDRRDFLTRSLPAGLCLGCWFALAPEVLAQEQAKKDKPPAAPTDQLGGDTSANSGMSYEQVFNFAFRDHSIPYLLAIADQIGREKLVEMLRSTTDDTSFWRHYGRRISKDLPAGFWAHVVTTEDIEKTEMVRVTRVTRCLWAETYRAANAADIGYAMWCYTDYATARLNKLKLERNQTLMQGHDCCVLKWIKEA
jgi:hypothetical protein